MKIIFFKEGKKMSKKKKIFILVSMVLLLVITGYLNVALNGNESELETTTTSANFFTSCRADKLASRNYQIEIYDSIIASSTDATEIANAKAMKAEIAAKMEAEQVLESLIAATGYEDVIVTNSDDNMNVFVKTSTGLTGDEVAKILSILTNEAKVLATNVKIIPVE